MTKTKGEHLREAQGWSEDGFTRIQVTKDYFEKARVAYKKAGNLQAVECMLQMIAKLNEARDFHTQLKIDGRV